MEGISTMEKDSGRSWEVIASVWFSRLGRGMSSSSKVGLLSMAAPQLIQKPRALGWSLTRASGHPALRKVPIMQRANVNA